MERRDYGSRAAHAQTILELLTSRVDGLTFAELPSEVPAVVAGRILKPLAIRGLVKVVEDHWTPSPAFFLGRQVNLQQE